MWQAVHQVLSWIVPFSFWDDIVRHSIQLLHLFIFKVNPSEVWIRWVNAATVEFMAEIEWHGISGPQMTLLSSCHILSEFYCLFSVLRRDSREIHGRVASCKKKAECFASQTHYLSSAWPLLLNCVTKPQFIYFNWFLVGFVLFAIMSGVP